MSIREREAVYEGREGRQENNQLSFFSLKILMSVRMDRVVGVLSFVPTLMEHLHVPAEMATYWQKINWIAPVSIAGSEM